MKVLKIVILTLLISFLLFIAAGYITFKYILTPEKIKNYVHSYIERTMNEQFDKYKTEMMNKISVSRFVRINNVNNINEKDNVDEDIEDFKILEEFSDTNMDMPNTLDDINNFSSKLFVNTHMKMENLKYRIKKYFSNKNIKEE